MADPINGNAPKTEAAPAATPTQPAVTAKSMDDLTGSEARILVEKAKAEGKSVEQVFAESQGQAPASKASANPIKEAAKEAVKEVRKHKVKYEGQEFEVDEEELKRGYAHQKAANKKLQEGLAARKQAEEFISMMRDKDKLFDVLTKLGHNKQDLRKMAENLVVSQLEEEMMDPRDKELKEARAKLKRVEDMERQQEEMIEKKRLDEMKQRYAKEFNEQFIGALKESGLPETKPMVAEMAKYISRSAKIGFKMTPQEAATLVKEDILLAHQRLIGDSDGEILIKLLGDNVANKIRKYDTQKLKSPEQVLRTPQQQALPEDRRERGQPKKRMTAQEWRLHKLGKK